MGLGLLVTSSGSRTGKGAHNRALQAQGANVQNMAQSHANDPASLVRNYHEFEFWHKFVHIISKTILRY